MYALKLAKTPKLWRIAAILIHELAEYEDLTSICRSTQNDIEQLFKENLLHAIIAFDKNGEPAGLLTYFYMISTFYGKKIAYMDDLFLREKNREKGLGKNLLTEFEKIAHIENCCKLEWKCLTWNKQAQGFYEAFGGKKDDENMTYYKVL
ncbi:GNAT family N-acetyltransferase [Pectinatus sottacetonis]|uniref:GNAT family N-acetyltransferase n=1 Tax=Pectinatus sottacetonis TaxID=1002795 RepID=UPI0018C7C449|nr:GNAT family N-acetyltransferase [Pectinatus sottacetonis]